MAETVKLENNTFFDAVKESLSSGSGVKIPVTGGSMRPFLRNGDAVSVIAFSGNNLKKGSIALGHWKEGYVLHRVVGAKGGDFVLAGDNNIAQVEMVASTEIFAVVTAGYRDGKLFSSQSELDRVLGLAWYYARPLRRIFVAVNRRLK